MAFDNTDIYTRISQLEDTDRKLAHEVSTLHGRLDTALITLTNNVNNLTDAIKALQESQSQTTALQHSMILLQERASVVPEMQKAINGIVIENATNNVLLKGIDRCHSNLGHPNSKIKKAQLNAGLFCVWDSDFLFLPAGILLWKRLGNRGSFECQSWAELRLPCLDVAAD